VALLRLYPKEIIVRLIENAKKKLWSGTVPFLINPVETPITVSLGKKKFYDNMGDGWKPMSIPRISCIADFESAPIDSSNYSLSYLTIAWFQNEWAMPIDEKVMEQIKCIEWDKYAVDGDY
tara:strand:- start:562 stop:924 length:363 start_codon:yes stop_codon:yes gene_type:complete